MTDPAGLLHKAISIALSAHAKQKDKQGEPYIMHPLRVMLAVSTTEERIVAVLHDVVEDSSVSLEDLRLLFPEQIVQAIDACTRQVEEADEDYWQRVLADPIAVRVKLADVCDNGRADCVKKLTAYWKRKLAYYAEKRRMLEEALYGGSGRGFAAISGGNTSGEADGGV